MSSAERRKKYQRIDFLDTAFWYRSQLDFFTPVAAVCINGCCTAKPTGKTLAAAPKPRAYDRQIPVLWTGKRFDKPIRCWSSVKFTMLVRDSLQRQLCGQEFGTGLISLEAFAKKPTMVPGGTGAIDTVYVTHETNGLVDGVSTLTFKSYEMRREKLQSESVSFIWCDERPDEDVYSELLARTSATDGHLVCSYTPVGDGAAAGVTYKFLSEPSADRAVFRFVLMRQSTSAPNAARNSPQATPRPSARRASRARHSLQRPGVSAGIAADIGQDVQPGHVALLARWCVGIDFGFRAPLCRGAYLLAHDTGQIWWSIASAWSGRRRSITCCASTRCVAGSMIPVAWPHDGIRRIRAPACHSPASTKLTAPT